MTSIECIGTKGMLSVSKQCFSGEVIHCCCQINLRTTPEVEPRKFEGNKAKLDRTES